MHWILLALLTATFYGLYNFFIKIASGQIHQIVGAVILQVVAALLGGLVLVYLRVTGASLNISATGARWAVLAGVFVGLAEITSFYVFSRGVSASLGIPVIIGGSVVVGALLGALFLRESLDLVSLAAIALIVSGVAILATKS